MKKLLSAAVVAALIAVPASAAIRHEHHFSLSFSAKTTRAHSGVTFVTDRFNYKAPPPGQQADRVQDVTFQMAPGTRTNPNAYPSCSKAKLTERGPAACPKGSQVGSGSAKVITGLPIDPIVMTAKVFTTRGGLLTYLTGSGQTQVIALKLSGNKIVAPVPHVCPTNDCTQVEAVLKYLKVSLKSGKLITTPGRCPSSKKWTNRAVYRYVNGDVETESSTSKCKG